MQEVKKHPNAHMQYVNKLLSEGTVTDAEVRDVHNRVQTIMQEEFDAAKDYRPSEDEWLSNVWEGFKSPAQLSRIRNTGARSHQRQTLVAVACHGVSVPHPQRQACRTFPQLRGRCSADIQ